jgi:hypothetical protein
MMWRYKAGQRKGVNEMISLLDLTEEQRRQIAGFEDDILDLIDGQDAYTRSDLQGIVMALVVKILNAGKTL